MVNAGFREQYTDALAVYLREQEVAGLDIVTDGDCRFDHDIGGQSWTSYPPNHMDGFEHGHPQLAKPGAARRRVSARPHPSRLSRGAGDAEARRPGRPRRHAIHRDVEGGAAPDHKPVKFGTVTAEVVAFGVRTGTTKTVPERIIAHRRRIQRGTARARRRRLPGDPDRGAADPLAGGARRTSTT